MKKLTLQLEALEVESFETHAPEKAAGTVKARDMMNPDAVDAITNPQTPQCTWVISCSCGGTCAGQATCGNTCPLTGCNTCQTCTLCPSGDAVCCA